MRGQKRLLGTWVKNPAKARRYWKVFTRKLEDEVRFSQLWSAVPHYGSAWNLLCVTIKESQYILENRPGHLFPSRVHQRSLRGWWAIIIYFYITFSWIITCRMFFLWWSWCVLLYLSSFAQLVKLICVTSSYSISIIIPHFTIIAINPDSVSGLDTIDR
jgi:hypothetical protein